MSHTLVKIIDDFQVELDFAQHQQIKSSSFTHALEQALSTCLLLEGAYLDSLVFDEMLRRHLCDVLDKMEQEIGFLFWREDYDDTIRFRITSLLFRIGIYRNALDLEHVTQISRRFRLPLVSRSDSFRGLEYNPDDQIRNRQAFNQWNKVKIEMHKEIVSISAEYNYNHDQHDRDHDRHEQILDMKTTKSRKQPPPPPPPPIKSKLTKRRSEITRLPKVIRLFHSFQSRRIEGCNSAAARMTSIKRVNSAVADPSAVIDELMSKSKHARQINEEITKYSDAIKSWAEEIRKTSFKTMNEMDVFVREMDDKINQHLTDEISIFKRFKNWPMRYDVMREANGKWRQLKELELALLGWKFDDRFELDEELKRMRDFIDRVDFRLQDFLRVQTTEESKYAKHELPWSPEIYEQVKRASLHVLEAYMKRVLQSIQNACLTTSKKRDILSNCACFAFKIHQMVGGFNNACTEAFTQIETVAQSVIKESSTISTVVSNPSPSPSLKSGTKNFTLIQPPCNVANC